MAASLCDKRLFCFYIKRPFFKTIDCQNQRGKRMRTKMGALFLLLWVVVGCTVVGTLESQGNFTREPVPAPEDIMLQRIEPFITAVTATGATAEVTGSVHDYTLFTAQLVKMRVNENDVTLYVYPGINARQTVSNQIRPDGSALIVPSGTDGAFTMTTFEWGDVPHFWVDGYLIILYIGQNQAMIDLMTMLYGPQIADGSIPYQPTEIGTGTIGGFGPLGDDETGGISMQYDLYLLYTAVLQRVPAEQADPNYGHAPAAPGPKPERIIITLQGDKFPETTVQPQIIISAEPFPATPLLNGEMVSIGEQPIAFQNGEGVRWVAQQMGQAATPVNNSDLVYIFNGKTADDRYFVYATIPVGHPELPNSENDVTNYETLLNDWSGYINEMQTMLNSQPPTSFIPDLTVIDAMLATLSVEPTSPLANLADRGFVDAPRLAQGIEAAQIIPGVTVDYWEIRDNSGVSEQQIVAQSGDRKGLETAVIAQLDTVTGPEWCGETMPPSCTIYVVSVSGNEVQTWMSTHGMGEFLGTIDTPEEAVLLAAAYDYGLSESSVGHSVRLIENRYELTALKMVNDCAPIQTDWFILHISQDGVVIPFLQAPWSRFSGCI
jgi:hypothetical protein